MGRRARFVALGPVGLKIVVEQVGFRHIIWWYINSSWTVYGWGRPVE